MPPVAAPAAGLVTSAKTQEPVLNADDVVAQWTADARSDLRFPSADDVAGAAKAFPHASSALRRAWQDRLNGDSSEVWRYVDGVFPHLDVAPGLVRFSRLAPRATEVTEGARRDQAARTSLSDLSDPAVARSANEYDERRGSALAGLWGGPLTAEATSALEQYRIDCARGVITVWSAKSRANLRATILSLDLAPIVADDRRTPAMLTLTAPGDWLTVFPDHATATKAFNTFGTLWRDAWGEKMQCIWKREFQRRGAPHWHLWMLLPFADDDESGRALFLDWLADAWARSMGLHRYEGPHLPDPTDLLGYRAFDDAPAYWDPAWQGPPRRELKRNGACCEHCRSVLAGTAIDTAEGMTSRDPRRLAAYFLKESGAAGQKAYQNRAPYAWGLEPVEAGYEGPANYRPAPVGRFWGVRGLEKAVAVADVEPREQYHVWRCLRGLRERQAGNWWISEHDGVRFAVSEASQVTADPARGKRLRNRVNASAGWVASNDGPALARRIATHLHRRHSRDRIVDRVDEYFTVMLDTVHRAPRPAVRDLAVHRRALGIGWSDYMDALRAAENAHAEARNRADAIDTAAADSWSGRRRSPITGDRHPDFNLQ